MKSYYFKSLLVVIGLTAMTLTSCKKSVSASDETTSAQDVTNVSNGMNSTSDDAASAAGQVYGYKGLGLGANWTSTGLLIGATITDTSSTGIVISYDGQTACNGIIRSGTITITGNGTAWHLPGAILTVNYNNFKITEVISGYTYTLNGTHTITNLTGGLAWKVVAGIAANTTVSHQIQSQNMSITYPNGSQRQWTVDRIRTWSSNGSTITVSLSSDAGAPTETGTNRFGESFTNTISSTIIADNTTCEMWRPYTGEWTHVVSSNSLNVVFGTNSTGTAVGTSTYCPSVAGDYGYYITLTRGAGTRSKFVAYW